MNTREEEYIAALEELRSRLADEHALRMTAEKKIEELQTKIDKKQIDTDKADFQADLIDFLRSDSIEYNSQHFMPMDVFKEEYFENRRRNGKNRTRWRHAHYTPVFDEFGVAIERVYNGTSVVKTRLLGIRLQA